MNTSIRACLGAGLAAACLSASAETLLWSENGPAPRFQTSPAYIKSGTDLPAGAIATLVSGNSNVKGPNGVEFLDGRVWWPDQQLGDIRSVKPDGSDLRVYGAGINPYDVDLVGSTLYWTDQNGNRIFTIDTGSATPWESTLLMQGLSHPVAIDVAGGFVYWSEVAGTNRLRRSNLDGSNAVTLISNIESRDFEVTDQYLYLSTATGEVARANLDGSGLVTLASGLGFLNGIDVTGSAIYVSVLNGSYTDAFVSTMGGGEIHRMNLDGSGDTVLYVAAEGPQSDFSYRADPIRGVAVLVAVPEPGTTALLLAGVGLIAFAARLRR
ncbi:MAG: DUF5050 domain-containing protein [Burkholderiales bacterium]